MSNVWPTVTRQNPCPICKHWDWTCRFGDKAVVCMRVESIKLCASGGWYHFYEDGKPDYVPKRKEVNVVTTHFDPSIAFQWHRVTTQHMINNLASELCVTSESLRALNTCFSQRDGAYAFPMFDGEGRICGIRLRNHAGFKWAVKGSKQGLFIPNFVVENCSSQIGKSDNDNDLRFKTCYIAEGPTDTAALLSMGLFAIGRASCNTGAEQIRQTLKRLKIYQAVVVADNDELKKDGTRPGIAGAVRLRKEIGVKSVVWIPPSPCKDVREFLKRGGTAKQIESDIKNRIWTK